MGDDFTKDRESDMAIESEEIKERIRALADALLHLANALRPT